MDFVGPFVETRFLFFEPWRLMGSLAIWGEGDSREQRRFAVSFLQFMRAEVRG